MPTDAPARLAYLGESVDLLWPRAGKDERTMVVLPSRRAPRVLAPLPPRRAAAAALWRYTAQQGPADRLASLALAALLGTGLGRFATGVHASDRAGSGESIDQLLTRVLGEPSCSALAITRARPNRKPVLHVFDAHGRTIAFAKVGVTPLARRLVDEEAAALRALSAAGPRHFHPPLVLHHGDWRDLSVLVTTALPLGRRVAVDRSSDGVLPSAMRELSGIGDGDGIGIYLAGLRERASAVDAGTGRWTEIVEQIVAARDLDGLATGAWHGDWTTWNCARRGRRLFLWDWERYVGPVPRGMDMLHFVLNQAVGERRDRFPEAVVELIDDAHELLRPWRLDRPAARSVATLYSIDLALRYLADSARVPGAGARVEDWARPAIHGVLQSDRRGATSR